MKEDFGYSTVVSLSLAYGFCVKMLHFYKTAKGLFIFILGKNLLLVNNQNRQLSQNQTICDT